MVEMTSSTGIAIKSRVRFKKRITGMSAVGLSARSGPEDTYEVYQEEDPMRRR